MVGLTLWEWVPLKLVGHTLVLSNTRMSVEDSVEKRMSLTFILVLIIVNLHFEN